VPRLRKEIEMKPVGRLLLLCSLLAPLPVLAGYLTMETNNPDIVVKRAFCVDYNIGGILVNKSGKPFRGRLSLAVRDDEGDIVGRHSIRLRASPENGTRFDMYYINTLYCSRQNLEFTVE
jgi:hypothetical protein